MYTLSTTAYGQASSCLRKYQYAQVDKLVPKYDLLAPNIRKGIWMHALLAAYHNGGDVTQELTRLVDWATSNGIAAEKIEEASLFCSNLIGQYTDYYEDPSRLEKWEVISTEYPYTLELPKIGVTLRATVDMVIKNNRGIFIVEHKTTSDIPNPNWRAVDPQTMLQLILVQKAGIQVDGVLFNYLLTKEPPVPRVTKDGLFYKTELTTTTAAFEKAWPEVRAKWKGTFGEMEKYKDEEMARMVNDSAWFQRYYVFRPDEALVETLKDVAGVIRMVKQAEEAGHYPRNFHIITCQRFCSYSELCVTEYIHGRKAEGLRQEMFQIDDGSREGR